jgi:PiT family inorganic phosphate transporter
LRRPATCYPKVTLGDATVCFCELVIIGAYKKSLDNATKFIPYWVKVSVALALGLGTMIGWKRIVVTVGEKIGKQHLTYGQGAAAEIVAVGTIAAADSFGLPVSTTHVLSSGVAGTMAANGSGVQMSTIRSPLLAWVLTLPCAIALQILRRSIDGPVVILGNALVRQKKLQLGAP